MKITKFFMVVLLGISLAIIFSPSAVIAADTIKIGEIQT